MTRLRSCSAAKIVAALTVCLAAAGCTRTSGTGTSGGWGAAMIAPGTSVLNGFQNGSTPVAEFTSLSCPAAGGCTAAGTYTDGQGLVGVFALNEAGGTWRSATPVPGLAALDQGQAQQGGSAMGGPFPSIHLSCSAPGQCAVGGDYASAAGLNLTYAASERLGAWGRAREIPGSAAGLPQATVTAITCSPAPGQCAAGGMLFRGGTPFPDGTGAAFIAAGHSDSWGAVQVLTGPALRNATTAEVTSLSCPTTAGCTGAGYYVANGVPGAFVVTGHDNRWGPAEPVPGMRGLLRGSAVLVSCSAAGGCQAAGASATTVEISAERGGRWGQARPLPGFAALNTGANGALLPSLTSLSCSAGNCAAGGSYVDHAQRPQAWVAAEVNGTWRRVQAVPQWGHLNYGWSGGMTTSVSCTRSALCIAGGYFTRHVRTAAGGQQTAFLVTAQNGVWALAELVPGLAALGHGPSSVQSVSCAPAASCVAAGRVMAGDITRLFVITR